MHAGTQFQRDLIEVIPALRAFARQLTRNVTEADDLVQETLVKALDAQHQFTLGTNLKAWTFTIMRRLRGMHMRKASAPLETIDDDQADRDANFAVAPGQEANLSFDDLDRAMESLPEEQRAVLMLVCADGLTYEEAAEVMGCEIGTIKSRLNRGRRTLESLLNSTSPQKMRRRTEGRVTKALFDGEGAKPQRALSRSDIVRIPRVVPPPMLGADAMCLPAAA